MCTPRGGLYAHAQDCGATDHGRCVAARIRFWTDHCVLCFRDSRLSGVESVNRMADHMAARRLLAGKCGLAPERAAEPGFDLKAHAAQAA